MCFSEVLEWNEKPHLCPDCSVSSALLPFEKMHGLIITGDSYGPSPVSGGAPSPPPMIEGPRRPPSAPVGRRIDPYGESPMGLFHFQLEPPPATLLCSLVFLLFAPLFYSFSHLPSWVPFLYPPTSCHEIGTLDHLPISCTLCCCFKYPCFLCIIVAVNFCFILFLKFLKH